MSAPVPILIVIPYFAGDSGQATDVCRIIAGLQPNHVGNAAHVMLAHRQDCKLDINIVKIVSPKFNVHTFQTRSPLRGWPSGPNGMFGSTMSYLSNNFQNKYECVYWMEPDAVPLCPNWFADLVNSWRGRHPTSLVVGCRSDCNGDGTGDHITGCALYHPNIARLMPQLTTCDRVAWDYQHRAAIVARGGTTNLIENFYNQKNAPPGIVDRINVGVRIIHGFKDRSVVTHVAKKYKIPLA